MPSGFSYFNSLDKFISYIRGVWLVFISVMLNIEISERNANSVDPVWSGSTLFANVPFTGR